MALRMRSRLSRTIASGRPTTVKQGRPYETSTSMLTGVASMPKTAAERTRASMRTSGANTARSAARIPWEHGTPMGSRKSTEADGLAPGREDLRRARGDRSAEAIPRLIFATVVSKSCAIEKSVSPFLTRYVIVSTFAGAVAAGVAAGSAIDREATAVGAARSERAARVVAGARGMISSWPGRSFDFTVRLFASATSARDMPNLRAPSAASHFFAVYRGQSAGEAPGRALASRPFPPVP